MFGSPCRLLQHFLGHLHLDTYSDTQRVPLSAMAFPLELPGEAAPLTPQQVYLALQSASSSQQQSIQAGTRQLQTWETQRGYYSLLHVYAPMLWKSRSLLIQYIGSLSGQVSTLRNSLFGNHPAQKCNRQILGKEQGECYCYGGEGPDEEEPA